MDCRIQQHGQVAQLVEQRTENPRVGGSIPPLGTISIGLLARGNDSGGSPRSLRTFSKYLPRSQRSISRY